LVLRNTGGLLGLGSGSGAGVLGLLLQLLCHILHLLSLVGNILGRHRGPGGLAAYVSPLLLTRRADFLPRGGDLAHADGGVKRGAAGPNGGRCRPRCPRDEGLPDPAGSTGSVAVPGVTPLEGVAVAGAVARHKKGKICRATEKYNVCVLIKHRPVSRKKKKILCREKKGCPR